MFFGPRSTVALIVFMLSWAVAIFFSVDPSSAGTTPGLLAGIVVTVVAVAAVLRTAHADDTLFGFGRTTRGPTEEEHRRRGELRRHSHPDTSGRPRPRSPGLWAEAVSTVLA
ncbi:DUF6412 domain-containing protein [Rhodococcus sp. HNM0563]|uniref:DUF6412 domain-containing protein n=1 Tax=Rhodococcus sp. HNM0563 TaxID=2716339 RepID=UPI001F0FACC8|nr:DUF6412 domain-containing protein [Rhodococcus sp. HNM0563]